MDRYLGPPFHDAPHWTASASGVYEGFWNLCIALRRVVLHCGFGLKPACFQMGRTHTHIYIHLFCMATARFFLVSYRCVWSF
ncbi:hypothetical protein F5X97DRAFT_296464 [Nemania serpens]|nr:hypothetical protein F5X97DRAFT_296464 [Nemania serpens]